MPRTPDRTHGPALEEELRLDDRTADGNPTVDGAIRFVSGDIVVKLSSGVVSLTAGTGLSKGSHDALRSLIHFINEGPAEGFVSGAFKEILPTANPFPTSVIWYESSGKTQKIVEKTLTYTGVFPTTIVWKMYDTDGTTVLATVTDAINYTGAFETDRTRTIA